MRTFYHVECVMVAQGHGDNFADVRITNVSAAFHFRQTASAQRR